MKASRIVITGAVALALVAGGTAAGAAIAGPVDSNGVIHGCYDSGGNVKVVLNGTDNCDKGYTSLDWNQQGPQGSQGSQGPQGATGPQGPQGVIGPAGPAGTDGVQIDAGNLYFNWDSQNGTAVCDGDAVGPDASTLTYTAATDIFNSSETWCQISGFPTEAVPVNVIPDYFNAFGGHQAPQPQVFTSRPHSEVGCDGVTSGWCITIDIPTSAVQNAQGVQYSWEAMETSPSGAASGTAATRIHHAPSRCMQLTAPRHRCG